MNKYRAKGCAKWFNPILKKWVNNVERYIEHHEYNDCTYWYNERANVSSLAGAAWACNGYAVEEFPCKKLKKGCKVKLVNGRCDLYISLGNDSTNIECKVVWINLLNESTYKEKLKEVFSKANSDIKMTMKGEKNVTHGGAITFIVPYYIQSKYEINTKTLKNQLQKVKKIIESKGNLYAWFENNSKKDIIATSKSGSKYIYNFIGITGEILKYKAINQ